MLRRLVPVALVAALGLSLASPAQATAPVARADGPRSGPLLVEGGVLTTLAGRSKPLRFSTYCRQASFSPDGSMIATVERHSICGRGQIVIERAHGRAVRLPRLPGRNGPITWSPDGREVATGVEGSGIYAQGIDGSAPRVVYDAVAGPVEVYARGAVSWSPHGDRIIFAGTDKGRLDDDDVSRGADRSYSRQLWTVPAAGGTPTPYNQPFVDPGCAVTGGVCRTLSFSDPRWAPDGSTVLVHLLDMTREGSGRTAGSTAIATISQDATQPTVIHTLARRDATHPGAAPWGITEGFTSFWSADGRSVVGRVIALPGQTRYRPGFSRWARIAVDTGEATPVGDRYSDVYDWQPCPTGSCVAWPTVRSARLSFAASRLRDKENLEYQVTGRVSPGQRGWVRLALEIRRVDRGWVRLVDDVAHREGGRFGGLIGWPRISAHSCRVVVTFRDVQKTEKVRC